MVGTAQPTTTATLQQQISSSSSSVALGTTAGTSASGEEEAFKRNTDCVYFLASPLTCKKGSECEYRHSDIARVNPRDCWYWLHGNCLNPKCGFRHPPLDGLLGTQGPNPAGPTVPPIQPATTPAAPASGKQGVACIFFQRGHCMRGDWCPFVHAPNSINTVNNKALQGQAAAVTTEALFKKTFGGHERPTQEQKFSQTNVPKPIDLLRQAKPVDKIDSAPVKNEISIKKNIPTTSAMDDELQRYRSTGGTPVDDRNQVIWSNRVQQPVSLNEHSSMNGKDAEEVSREPSPGFDVLVDDELRDSDYYHGEDQFGRTVDREGRSEYFDGQSGDYSSMVDADRDIYHESHGYDSYERLQGQYAREQRRSSSERMLGGLSHPEKRLHGRPESPDRVGESDLRYRLSKHRRGNGLRSVINQDYARERFDDRGHQNSQREPRHDRARQESSFSSRLQGRIRIPGRPSSAADGNDLRLDRENEKGRDHSGLSQGRSQLSSRLRDRIKGNLQEDVYIDSQGNRGLRMGRDTVSDNNANFVGPKSLAELKGRRNFDRNEQHLNDQLGKRKFSKLEYQQQTGGEVSFEGPKPLQEILKRKRGSRVAVSGSGTSSGDNEDDTWKKSEESSIKAKGTAERRIDHSLLSKNDSDLSNDDMNEQKTTSGVKDRAEGSVLADGQSLNLHNANEAEVEDGMIVEDGAEGQELETYEHGDEDSYYEQGDGEDYNLEEGDNGDPEEEYLDDGDGDGDGDGDDDGDDDFAKKMGVMY